MKWKWFLGFFVVLILSFMSGVFLKGCEQARGAEMVGSSVFAKRDYYAIEAALRDHEFLDAVKEILNKSNTSDELFCELNISYNKLVIATKSYKIVVGIFDKIDGLEKETRSIVEQDKQIIARLFSRQEIFDACLEKFR